MSSVAGTGIEVVRVNDEHIPPLAEFYRRVWNPDATPDSVRESRAAAARANTAQLGEAPPTWLVLQNGTAIAHVTTIPVRLWHQARAWPAYWIKGLWVLPEVQRSSAGFLVLRAAAKALDDASMALVHEPAAIRLFQAIGYTDLGGLPNRLCILRPRSVLARLDVLVRSHFGGRRWLLAAARLARAFGPVLGPVLGGMAALWVSIRTGSLRGLTITVTDRLDGLAVDNLWQSVRDDCGVGVVRDASHLAARYDSVRYKFVEVRDAGELRGLAIVKRPSDRGDHRLAGLRLSTLSDALYAPSDRRVGLALLRGAERAAKAFQSDALLVSTSPRIFDAALRVRRYLTIPANLHVLVSVPGSQNEPRHAFDEWWVTRGDSEADGTF